MKTVRIDKKAAVGGVTVTVLAAASLVAFLNRSPELPVIPYNERCVNIVEATIDSDEEYTMDEITEIKQCFTALVQPIVDAQVAIANPQDGDVSASDAVRWHKQAAHNIGTDYGYVAPRDNGEAAAVFSKEDYKRLDVEKQDQAKPIILIEDAQYTLEEVKQLENNKQ